MTPTVPFQEIRQNEDPREVYKDIARNLRAGQLNTWQAEALIRWIDEMQKIYPPRDSKGELIKGQ